MGCVILMALEKKNEADMKRETDEESNLLFIIL